MIPAPACTYVELSRERGNPAVADTDGDGYLDGEDSNPFVWNVSDRDLAMCSQIAYTNILKGTVLDQLSTNQLEEIKEGFNGEARIEELSRWQVVESWWITLSSMNAIAFKIDSNIIIAYRGSQEFYDWLNDASTYIDGVSFQAPSAKLFAQKVLHTYGKNHNVYITGHSLGGNLAYYGAASALSTHRSAIKGVAVFNGLGLTYTSAPLVEHYLLQKNSAVIRNYSVAGDIVSQGFLGFTTLHYGTAMPLTEKIPQAKSTHNLCNFLAVLNPIERYKRIIQDEEWNNQ